MPKVSNGQQTKKSAGSQQKGAKAATAGGKKGGSSYIKYLVSIVIIVAIIGVAIFASSLLGPQGTGNNSFLMFQKNYDSASRVDIFVTSYNGTILSSTIGCATAVIEQLVANKQEHRNASTIDLNIINRTSCIRSKGLGTATANYTVTSLQNCLNTSSAEPSIYINYSTTNQTIIKPDYLYISGDAVFLQECGLASEFS
jgi:hypothetical protein